MRRSRSPAVRRATNGRPIQIGPLLERPAHLLYPSPLRYPGGKGQVSNFFKLLFLENDLLGSEYVEPFAGGASVALSLLFEKYASHVHINDVDRSVSAFWTVVLEQPEALCRRIRDTRPSVAEWDRQRAVQKMDEVDSLEPRLLDLLSQPHESLGDHRRWHHRWARADREVEDRCPVASSDSISRIEKIARFASRITFTSLDTAVYLERVLPSIGLPFLYLDPALLPQRRGPLHELLWTRRP
jgi:DNA adenine methylase